MSGGTLAFSTDPNVYLPAVLTRVSGIECMNYSPCIYAYDKTNIAVTGGGTLDGQAANENWWSWKGVEQYGWAPGTLNQEVALARLRDLAERAVPVEERIFGTGDMLRPMFIQPYRCQSVLIEGVTILRTPSWALHPVLCSNVTVRGVTVASHGPNNDGCNPESCTDVLIEECVFDTGDDCIAIKSGRNNDGRRLAVPTANVVVRNCRMKNGHGAMTIGSEISGGARHVFFEKCTLEGPRLGWAIRFKTNAQRGGTVEHVYFRDITVMSIRGSALAIDFQYDEGAAGSFNPILKNIAIATISGTGIKQVMEFRGIPNGFVENVLVRNCTFDQVNEASVIESASGVTLSDVRVNGRLITTLSELAA
ncbi:glycoside hydrolase family 28 protein [Mycolicibacterium sp. PAM1]|uniref:glycoside hydrolase family 28 protein n=1 Tax=Mycolicibacterium sp. PAM1 TaxID=2853535 RepID=UPI001C3C40D9|nr:glycoside hydrolase family 28 protein [Mycolicibacterium sp. PAM1]MBV5246891.1 glycoside hydrolase family 28 protein [Mycolicibacterium sp. PAM1]